MEDKKLFIDTNIIIDILDSQTIITNEKQFPKIDDIKLENTI